MLPQELEQRWPERRGLLDTRRLSDNPRRRQVGRDERDTLRAHGDVVVQGHADGRRNGVLEVVHQLIDAVAADEFAHDAPSVIALRSPRKMRRARWTRCRTAAGSTPRIS